MTGLRVAGLALVLALFGTSAQAAGWDGFYLGGNLGLAAGSADSSLSIADGAGASCHFNCNLFGGAVITNDGPAAQSAGSPSFSPNGFSGGVQLGYNWQVSSWLYGFEADFGAFSQNQTVNSTVNLATTTASALGVACAGACQGSFSTSVKADWLLTLRPRIGYIWADNLVYATGGLAFTRISTAQAYTDNFFAGSESSSAAATKLGWVVGTGFEHAFGPHWTAKVEYLYVHFEKIDMQGSLIDTAGGASTFSNSVGLSSNLIRVGFNYRF